MKKVFISFILSVGVVFSALSQGPVTCGGGSSQVTLFETLFAPDNCAGTPFYDFDKTVITKYEGTNNNVSSTITPSSLFATTATQVGAGRYGVVRRPQEIGRASCRERV